MKKDFNKNILTLLSGTMLAQAVPIIATPILTRLYTPDDFAKFGIFVSICSIMMIISSGKYELAIMQPKKDIEAINLFVLCFLISLFFCVVLCIFMFCFYFFVDFGFNEVKVWICFVPISVFFISIFNSLTYFNIRIKKYKDLQSATIVKSFISIFIQILCGISKIGFLGLIYGQVASNLIANTKLLKNIFLDKNIFSKISIIKIYALAKKYKKFPLYSMPSSVCDSISQQIPFVLIPAIFGLSVGGFFVLAKKIVGIPASLFSNSVSNVFYQTAMTNIKNKEKIFPLFFYTFKKLFLISAIITSIGYFAIPKLFIIFGENWLGAVDVAQFLILIMFITFIVSPLSVSFSISMELNVIMYWQIGYLISTCFFFLFVWFFKFDFDKFFLFFLVHEYIMYGIYMILIWHTVKKIDKKI